MKKFLILFIISYYPLLSQVKFNMTNNSNEDNKFIFGASIIFASSSISIIDKDYINIIDNDYRYGVGTSVNLARKFSDTFIFNLNINYINFLWKTYDKYEINIYYISFDVGIKTFFIHNKIRPFLNLAVGSYFLNANVNSKYIVVGTFQKEHIVRSFGIPLTTGFEYINSQRISTHVSLRLNNLFPNLEYKYFIDLSLGFNYEF